MAIKKTRMLSMKPILTKPEEAYVCNKTEISILIGHKACRKCSPESWRCVQVQHNFGTSLPEFHSSLFCAVLHRLVVSNSLQTHEQQPARLLCSWGLSRQEYWVDCHALLQGIFTILGSNPGLPHCRWLSWILYQLSHQRNPIFILLNH